MNHDVNAVRAPHYEYRHSCKPQAVWTFVLFTAPMKSKPFQHLFFFWRDMYKIPLSSPSRHSRISAQLYDRHKQPATQTVSDLYRKRPRYACPGAQSSLCAHIASSYNRLLYDTLKHSHTRDHQLYIRTNVPQYHVNTYHAFTVHTVLMVQPKSFFECIDHSTMVPPFTVPWTMRGKSTIRYASAPQGVTSLL